MSERSGDPGSVVVGAVGGDDDREAVLGVVGREEVLDAIGDHRFLVEGGNDHGDAGELDIVARLTAVPTEDARQSDDRNRISDQHVSDSGQGGDQEPAPAHLAPMVETGSITWDRLNPMAPTAIPTIIHNDREKARWRKREVTAKPANATQIASR